MSALSSYYPFYSFPNARFGLKGFNDDAQLESLGHRYLKSGYGEYLLALLHQN
jgi:hypothetical protein